MFVYAENKKIPMLSRIGKSTNMLFPDQSVLSENQKIKQQKAKSNTDLIELVKQRKLSPQEQKAQIDA